MKKLQKIMGKLLNGEKVRGVPQNLYIIRELETVYGELLTDGKSEFLCADIRKILDQCGIHTEEKGIGYVAAI